ncbi:hypothetical protein F5Y08DRAFT_301184 [Xylaria arbuscula]|nr:hypothetical protein F5Y08DRAFT_301184 [Xylaria arbuscula]
MADARALLRAHRAENRIKHPHAAYSDAGKLLCKLCHDVVKADSLWDSHVRSLPHRQKLQTIQQQQQQQPQQPSPPFQSTEDTQKRKRGEDEDERMSDNNEEESGTIPAKRSKTDGAVTQSSGPNGPGNGGESNKEKTQTPPGLARRTSGTPVHGVEIAIPSRPATPLAGSNSAVSTPKAISMTKSPLAGSDRSSISGASAVTSIPISTDTLAVPAHNTMQAPSARNETATTQKPSGAVDEAEWAAFEAEMSVLGAPAPAPPVMNGTSHPYADATISAPALSAAQVAAKSEEEEHERRKHALEAEIADEREDATRALEEEFEEMEELESRVRRLKERREELRKGSVMNLRGAAEGKENLRNGELDENMEEEDDDDDEEDEWDGFRFRA